MPRGSSNLLALAVLVLLAERPMHPYEMAATLRMRGKDASIKINYGSLYTVVEGLLKAGQVEVRETVRDGRRPERTVYGITDAGLDRMRGWMTDLIGTPVKEYLRFEAGLSFLAVLPPDEAARLLRDRRDLLAVRLEEGRATVAVAAADHRLPRLFFLEEEYVQALAQAEVDWIDALVPEIEAGTLDGCEFWSRIHTPDGLDIAAGQEAIVT